MTEPSAAEGSGSRVLALDLGESRIGVAVSDPDRRVAVGLGTIRTGAPQDLKSVAALVAEHAVREIVVGHPLLMAGGRGERAAQAERFAEALSEALRIPVHLQDERLTTVEAERRLSSAGHRGRGRRGLLDQAAAVLILQSYLDRAR